jgi:hypothetical protein
LYSVLGMAPLYGTATGGYQSRFRGGEKEQAPPGFLPAMPARVAKLRGRQAEGTNRKNRRVATHHDLVFDFRQVGRQIGTKNCRTPAPHEASLSRPSGALTVVPHAQI